MNMVRIGLPSSAPYRNLLQVRLGRAEAAGDRSAFVRSQLIELAVDASLVIAFEHEHP